MSKDKKEETRGRKRKNRNYISFKTFEKKFDCSPYQRRVIEKERGFTVVPMGKEKKYKMHEVLSWEQECLKQAEVN